MEHILTGDRAGADPERVSEIAKRLTLVHRDTPLEKVEDAKILEVGTKRFCDDDVACLDPNTDTSAGSLEKPAP